MSNQDHYYMEMALQEARKAAHLNEIPVGCVIVKDNEVIAKAHNLKESLNQATAHAEILAINNASNYLNDWRLSECTLYVTLEPCPMCASAIVQSRIKRVVFGAMDNKQGAVVSSMHIFENNHNHNLLVTTKIMEDECNSVIKEFLNRRR